MGLRWMRRVKDGSLLGLARATARSWTRPHWRILCYHGVQPAERDSFARQLAWFAERFTFCTVSEGMRLLLADALQYPMLSVTFDDGHRTIYDVALPVLEPFAIKATLYVTADYIVRGRVYRDSDAPAMLPEQLQDWVSRGHEIGSHSLTHAPMRLCSRERFDQEVLDSKAILEDIVSRPVVHFSYPWGQHSRWTVRRLRELGIYQTAATIDRGAMVTAHAPLRLRRDLVDPRMSLTDIETTMKLADNFYWLRYLKRKGKGYWVIHPEVSWDELAEVGAGGVPAGAST